MVAAPISNWDDVDAKIEKDFWLQRDTFFPLHSNGFKILPPFLNHMQHLTFFALFIYYFDHILLPHTNL